MMSGLYRYTATRAWWFAAWFLATLLSATAVDAAQVTLAWDPNSEPDLAGYRIYYGTASHKYTVTVKVGKATSCVVSSLQVGKTYYFAATAYDTEGLESAFSKELAVKIVEEPPVCECDLDDNGSCTIMDWTLFVADWGRSDCNDPYVDCECDLDDNGSCNIMDWSLFMADWGRTDCK